MDAPAISIEVANSPAQTWKTEIPCPGEDLPPPAGT